MVEVTGDLWKFPADIRVITTNGYVKKNGECVMGRGCAFEASRMWPGLPLILGGKIRNSGNHVHMLSCGGFGTGPEALVSFPVKHNWYEKADLDLIRRSAIELRSFVANYKHTVRVVMPRPGCGNGQLSWDQVKPVLEGILDERFSVITFA